MGKKLIEVALPLAEINDASAYDKMPGIGPHPKGIHHWWARLPLPSARAVLFASVVNDPSTNPDFAEKTEDERDRERERLFGIIRRLMQKKLHEHPEIYAEAQAEMIKHCGGRLPPVYDPFAGGGSIPLEANRLGFQAYASDLNPVAVLLNKCNLEMAPRWAGHAPVNAEDRARIGGDDAWRGTHGLAADVRYYGRVIRERAMEKIGVIYPPVIAVQEEAVGFRHATPDEIETWRRDQKRKDKDPSVRGESKALAFPVIAWIWARTVKSPNPAAQGKHVPLMSTFWLSSKKGLLAWLEPTIDDERPNGWRFVVRTGKTGPRDPAKVRLGTRAGKASDFLCLLTGAPIPRDYIQAEGKAGELGRVLVAIVVSGGNGKAYLDATTEHESVASIADSDQRVAHARSSFLSGTLPDRANITGGVCSAYGLSTWGHLFTARQLSALLTLSDLVREVGAKVSADAIGAGLTKEHASEYAQAVTTLLALACDRCSDFNNALCRWSSTNQKVMNLFGRQALPMVWDAAEANILGDSVGAWKTCEEYVADCTQVLIAASSGAVDGRAWQTDAAIGSDDLSQLIVSTDPPYYDNISYATLSDFFYVWLRRTVGHLYKDVFATVLTPKLPELTASRGRFDGDKGKAKEHFEDGFRKAFTALREKMDGRFPLTVYYAFKQTEQEADEVVRDSGDGGSEDGGSAVIDLTTGWETLLSALIESGFQVTATWPVRATQKWKMNAMAGNALASYIVLACRVRPADAPMATRQQFQRELKQDIGPALRALQHGNIAPVDLAQAAIGPGMAVFSQYRQVVGGDGKPMTVRAALMSVNQARSELLGESVEDFDPYTRFAVAWFEQYGFSTGEHDDAEKIARTHAISVGGVQAAGLLAVTKGKARLLRRSEMPEGWDPAKDARRTVWEMTQHLIRLLDVSGEKGAAELLVKLGATGEYARDLAYRLFNTCERKGWAEEARSYNGLVIAWPELARLAAQVPARPGTAQSEMAFGE